jgi:hypothetical protein
MSGQVSNEEYRKLGELGIFNIIQKPFSVDQFEHAISKAFL